ncbi:GNAT family N-acetyltransferase [Clostridium thermobutyricum]|uniref:Acetyltransferase (GNAT) family protein n=1 Tax=Clostridium thermobutyricum DSM 4928 TaxID=1121339 RepID=A0A1V4SWS8_9CLOT|nr:GNAT family N-acetyltransferase [Clostridium thermobutyricum]OPX48764.1 acetyltransferase (GNAT) family protein [Clostridium thermobutyricum DSM 4928]
MYIQTSIDNLKLKRAKIEDTGLILDLIKEIATYEKMLDQVVATEESLKESIFNKKEAEVLFVELNKEVIGYVLYFFNYSTFIGRGGFYLEDIYIKEQYRKNGYGKAIFKVLGKIAYENGCERMEWACLNWNKPSIEFYKSLGAVGMDEWTVYRLTRDKIKALAES